MEMVLLLYLAVGIWFAILAFFDSKLPPFVKMFWLAVFVPFWPVAMYWGIRRKGEHKAPPDGR